MLSVSREASGAQPGPGKNSARHHQRGYEVAGGGGRVLHIHVHLLRVISTPPCPSCHVTHWRDWAHYLCLSVAVGTASW